MIRPLGAVLTASEIMGVHPAADWSRWIAAGRAPSSGDGNGHRVGWAEDLAQLATLGFDEVAVTLEWAALEPEPGRRDLSRVEHDREVFLAAKEVGLQPWACLVDGTLPGWFADDERGFVDDRSRNVLWPRHVDWVGEHFADLVAGWIPQREPIHHIVRSQLLGLGPPGRQGLDHAAKAIRAAVLTDGEAGRILAGSAPVATYQTARLFVPSPDDVRAAEQARWLDGFLRSSWSTAITEGIIGVEGYLTTAGHLREAFDRIIVQLRPAVSVDREGNWSPMPQDFLVDGLLAAFEQTIGPLPEIPTFAAADLAPVDDEGDAQLDHLRALYSGVLERGASGWWQTSPIDGWHWERGFDQRGGIIEGDRTERRVAEIVHSLH